MNRMQRPLVGLLLTTPVSAALVFSMLIVAGIRALRQGREVLSLETHIPLPSVKGRIGHFSVDVKSQRISIAAFENHTVEIVDLKSGQPIHTISDLAEPRGVFYDPSTKHLFVACDLDGVTKIFVGIASVRAVYERIALITASLDFPIASKEVITAQTAPEVQDRPGLTCYTSDAEQLFTQIIILL